MRVYETALVVFLLLLFSEALLGRLFATEQNPEGGAFLRFMWLPVYGVTLCMLFVHRENLSRILLRSPALVLLVLLTLCSALWSLDPATSFRRGIAAICTAGFGFYLAAGFSWRDMLRCLGLAWLILAVGNLIAGGLFPGFGRMQEIHPGAWCGLWFEKNQMGGNFARSAFLFAFLIATDRDWRRLWIIGLVFSAALVLLSTSKTSLLGLILGSGILLAYLWMRTHRLLALASMWLMFTVSIFATIFVMAMPETVVSIMGRDLTLTGRTDIWEVLLREMEQRPLLGFGYGTFWAAESEPAMRVRLETEWNVPTAHNGILEVMLALGQIGAALFIIDYLLNAGRSLLSAHLRASSAFAFGYLAIYALFSVSESVILVQNNITWLTYCAIAGKLALDRLPSSDTRKSTQPFGEIRLAKDTKLRGRLRR